jgi:hypothetical protein
VGEGRLIVGSLELFAAKLDNHAPGKNDSEADPGGRRHIFVQDESAAQNAGQREETHIGANEPGEIPSHRTDQHAVGGERRAAAENPSQTAAAQSASQNRVAGYFQTGGAHKNQPCNYIHYAGALCGQRVGAGTKNALQKR